MAQKPLAKGKKSIPKPGKGVKKKGGNKGKLYEKTKKGRLNIAPKKQSAKIEYEEKQMLSKVIEAKNEATATAKATNAVDKLHVLKANRDVCESLKAKGKKSR
mmetsp:Transcript_19146/g.53377  ORF Transcript_19146/g.53377 Transcript_19146/m.53377 type:complete len:103 (-) Transcript_19146:509-817(-)|eukprot:CAMPEP_0117677386 /NCGR_PEP_ID=MMETSP0804-20121206/16717_1 /TAXON_ID=1074897 /ORGANISM="Tetraselmis astigmatica, Strain CCMP880" /LENGTH=102 /DNA_ID=CAMNT_0005486665 /DNA_START=164 /DNA_END=472 /DNA_ORIENTATION=+